MNNKVKDLKEYNYNFNYNNFNYNYNQIDNSNFLNENKIIKETIDINDIGKIMGREINNSNYLNIKNQNNEINNLENEHEDKYKDYLEIKNENEKLIEENISLKNKLEEALKKLNEYELKDSEMENTDKEIENRLQSLQNKIEIYEESLDNTKRKYDDQIFNYQKGINDLNNIYKVINNFFNNIENKFINLNLNYKNFNPMILEQNFNEIEKYIYELNHEIKVYSEHNNLNNEQIEEEYCSNIENKKENNNYIKKPKQIKKNSTYNFYDEKEENQNIYNNDINTNNTTNDFYNFNENITNNKAKVEYKLLEQRIKRLENKLINQQNIYDDSQVCNRGINYYPYNTQQNSNIFQNGVLSEKVRPLSTKNSTNKFEANKEGKIKKKKRKTRMKFIEDGQKYDNNSKNKNKTFSNINRGKSNRNNKF